MNFVDPAIAPYLVFISVSSLAATLIWLIRRVIQKNSMVQSNALSTTSNKLSLRVGFEKNPARFDREMEKLVEQSGISMRSGSFVLLSIGCSLVIGMLILILFDDVVLAMLGVLATIGFMGLFVLMMRKRRREQVRALLPVAIDMIARGVRAGDGMEKSMLLTSQRLQGPLKADLQECANQMQLGLPLQQALGRLEGRSELFELRMLNSALAINRSSGGDLARMLERLARVLHERLEYRTQVANATAAARLAALIIGSVGPGLLVYYVFQNDYVDGLWQNKSAQFYILLALSLELVGIIWLLALTKSEYK